jgi:WD40 repeat protein
MVGSHIAFHPNGVQLFSVRGDGQFQLFDLPSGRIVWKVQGISEARGIAVSPDGKILVAVNSWAIQVLATESGDVLYEMKTDIQPISLAFSMNGKTLAIGCGDSTLRLFQVR